MKQRMQVEQLKQATNQKELIQFLENCVGESKIDSKQLKNKPFEGDLDKFLNLIPQENKAENMSHLFVGPTTKFLFERMRSAIFVRIRKGKILFNHNN